MSQNTGEIRVPRVARHQRLVLVNKPEESIVVSVVTCEPENHVPEAKVPNEGLAYVWADLGGWMWQCAFCGAQRRLS